MVEKRREEKRGGEEKRREEKRREEGGTTRNVNSGAERARAVSNNHIIMVEGHGVHRVAERHKKLLLGKVFKATSPNGRFKEGAKHIHDRQLSRIEAIGKNLFYFWGGKGEKNEKREPTVVHIHFGMSGQFKTGEIGQLEPTPNTRLELVNSEHNLVAHLSAMTVKHGDLDFYESKRKSLGQDPLRRDARGDLVWEKFQKSRKSVGMLLMDQSVIAGVGNIYRAEILFKAGIHPEQPGNTLDYESFSRVWNISRDLLHRGFKTGSILTVDPDSNLGPPWTRRYIYNHSSCGVCGSKVKSWDMGGRTCYACLTCQKLNEAIPQERKSKLKLAKEHKPFLSHCAPEPASELNLNSLTVKALKEMLKKHNLSANGRKAELIERLSNCSELKLVKQEEEEREVIDMSSPASAFDAAQEKVKAGEKRNVEHVALVEVDTETQKLATKKKGKIPFRQSKKRRQVRGK